MSFIYSVPTKALVGAGQLQNLHNEINNPMGCVQGKKALVVISNGKSTKTNGSFDKLEEQLKFANQ